MQRRFVWSSMIGMFGFGMIVLAVSGCGLMQDTPPTVTPIVITATPVPQIVPIVATETPKPTSVLAATNAVALPTQGARTATPTPAPPITMTPSFTPTTTDTPVTQGAVNFLPVGGFGSGVGGGAGCANVPQGTFGAIYQGDPNLPAALGCPLAPAGINASSAYQPFQNGFMVWVSTLGAQPQSAIYVFYNNGTYQRFNDTFVEGVDPASGGAVPPAGGLLEPVRGFGKVWRDNPGVSGALGWATTGESGGSAQVLLFERGEMLSITQTGQTYILITGAPGTWTAR